MVAALGRFVQVVQVYRYPYYIWDGWKKDTRLQSSWRVKQCLLKDTLFLYTVAVQLNVNGCSDQQLFVSIFASKQVAKAAGAKIRSCLGCLLPAPPEQSLGKSM